ncbi:hypothetical protein [Streptomyces brevispora]|uniref:Uncharacterized protein n=1 Tax=Streptomyces brevispora TaxID=887462 RepID=A0A561TUP8_9ACTN|nr:hypothetical protein [Streptomyces brevispora]TWF90839.1 hypothetical protein FHX80_13255 [Streptomyces brevispora]WSC11629.1 hypothetical protein OIE64_01225 [Streptomyces brevispora]
MTTAAAQPPRDRALGRGISTLIPQAATATPAEQAAAVLAAMQSVPVRVGVLQAAVVLLEERVRATSDDAERAAAATTVAMLRTAISQVR